MRGVELARLVIQAPQTAAHWRCLADWCAKQGLHDQANEFAAIAAIAELIVTIEG
jgi:hypothetical protein